MKKYFIIIFVLIVSISFAEDTIIRAAVAANLTYAFKDLKSDFEKKNPGVRIEANYGSSGKLSAQIREGAPFDIFFSADVKYPEALYNEGFTGTKPVIYARGKLVMFTLGKYDIKKGMNLVNDKKIRTISIANPDTAPYGAATIEALIKSGLYEPVKSKVVKAESISQVIHQTVTAADIGFSAKSLFYSEEMKKYKEGVNWIEIDPKLYKPIDQAFVIIKAGIDKSEVKKFYDYINSVDAGIIFEKYGYGR